MKPVFNTVLFAFVLWTCATEASFSEETETGSQTEKISEQRQGYRDQIHAILEQDDFSNKKMVTLWRLKNKPEETDNEDPELAWVLDVLKFFFGQDDRVLNTSKVLEFLLWCLFIGLLVYLIIRYREHFVSFVKSIKISESEPDLPATMFGLELSEESLPSDVVAQAKQHWQAGELREAVGLLLRASLSKLMHEYDCRFEIGDTEEECFARIERHNFQVTGGASADKDDRAVINAEQAKSLLVFMRQLTNVWQQLAYAHRAPAKRTFDTLCELWRVIFNAK